MDASNDSINKEERKLNATDRSSSNANNNDIPIRHVLVDKSNDESLVVNPKGKLKQPTNRSTSKVTLRSVATGTTTRNNNVNVEAYSVM